MEHFKKTLFLFVLSRMAVSNVGANGQNFTNCSSVEDSHDDTPVDKNAQVIVPIVFGLILIFGVVGNGSVILIVLKSKQMRSIPNIYLVSLALGDLLLILCAVPFSAFVFTFPSWIFGEAPCKISSFLETLSLGVSVFTLTLLSFDRYMAISHPMRKRSVTSMSKTILRASAVWIISLCFAIPDGVISGVRLHSYNGYCTAYCDPYKPEWGLWYKKFHVTLRFVVFFAIPVLIIALCYCLMARTLCSSNSHILVESASKRHGSSKTKAGRTQVAKMVLSFVLVFIICWLPRHIYLIGLNYDLFDFDLTWYVIKVGGFCLAFMNSCLNPMALYLQSEQFRKFFCRYFCRCCPQHVARPGSENIPTTVVSQCHYTKGTNEDSSSALLKLYKE